MFEVVKTSVVDTSYQTNQGRNSCFV